MQINQVKTVPVNATKIRIYTKVCDNFSASLHDQDGAEIGSIEQDYVPGFFPEEHYGDYLILDIDIDSGKITNWKVPSAEELQKAFKLGAPEEE